MTVAAALREGAQRLHEAGLRSSRLDAAWLLEDVLERDAAWCLAHGDAVLTEEARARFEAAVLRRAAGEPVAYVTGRAGFYGRTFVVDRRVLVPRPETELLVERALAALRLRANAAGSGPLVLDVGTGSGILAITLACEVPQLRCVATDLSEPALAVARANAAALGVSRQVEFRAGDLLAATAPGEHFDCVVANLPYVETDAMPSAPDPVWYEPLVALDGGPDGLGAYRRLFVDLDSRLNPGAHVLLEAGAANTPGLASLAAQRFPTAAVAVHRDFSGHPRLVEMSFP